MRKFLWVVPLILAAVFVAVFLRRNPFEFLDMELKVIDEKARVKKLQVMRGAEHARAQIQAENTATIEKFDADQKAQAEKLRRDPVRLAAFLMRAGRES